MDNLAAMQIFVKVVETGGLSAAGRALGIAPSSVTRRVTATILSGCKSADHFFPMMERRWLPARAQALV